MKPGLTKVLVAGIIAVVLGGAGMYMYMANPGNCRGVDNGLYPFLLSYVSPNAGILQSLDLTHYAFRSSQVKFTNQAITPNAILWAGTAVDVEPPSGMIQYVFKDPQRWPNGGFPQRQEAPPEQQSLQPSMRKTNPRAVSTVATRMDTDEWQMMFPGMGAVTFTAVQGYVVYFRAANGREGQIDTFRKAPGVMATITLI